MSEALTPQQLAARHDRALFAAALRTGSGTALTDAAVHDVCMELLRARVDLVIAHEAEKALAADNERLRGLIRSGRGRNCQWCGSRYDQLHLKICIAFTANGEVR